MVCEMEMSERCSAAALHTGRRPGKVVLIVILVKGKVILAEQPTHRVTL